jgi:DNA sulfur modification protein DndD
MIIKEIRIKNFRSYYGDNNIIEFSECLTLILGENGDGKTTFFEALQWLFDTTNDRGNIDHVSEMRKSKLEIGERDNVSVYLSFEHNGLKSVEKSFVFEKTSSDTFKVSVSEYRGYETNGVERIHVSGKNLIDRYYDAFIRRFSMFKGESELNVFNDKEALKQLVDKFSDIRKFDQLVDRTKLFAEKSNTAYRKEMNSDVRVSEEARVLDRKIIEEQQSIRDLEKEIREKEISITKYSTRLSELESNHDSSQRYKEIEDRRKTQEEIKYKLIGKIRSINYNHNLLDKFWVLAPYFAILDEFKHKCSVLSKERRAQEQSFMKKQSEEVGKIKAYQEVQAEFVKLPWFVPDETHMKEMVEEHVCKVCGRPFEENSDAHKFILEKIKTFQEHTLFKLRSAEEIERIREKTLFKNKHIEELTHLSISLGGTNQSFLSGIAQEIVDSCGLVDRLTLDLKKVTKNLQEIQDEKARLLIQAGNVSEESLEKDFKDIKGLFQLKEKDSNRLVQLNADLGEKNKKLSEYKSKLEALDPQSSKVKVMREAHRVLDEIAKAFANAKEENLRRFLAEIEEKANRYLALLSASDFHGNICLVQTASGLTEIKLFSLNDVEIRNPSGSQETVMYMSILFAISEITHEKHDEDYPLLFDAPTSSFGDAKEADFYNVINTVNKQCIITTKDFITKGKVRFIDIEKLNCPVYRIKKAEGFDPNNLATIRTTIEKIKE